ncbi:MAG: hypothetical protein H6610_09695 [Ignavibacteriales bacterium]|nr:hypothetical protein [Ignavibacteriales bacterium]MCB9210474.1 hypothetical protein [Ignavibacteriales bacterium]MCB9219715.1 hypothetical protein [Ignavibacteriales bacterium]
MNNFHSSLDYEEFESKSHLLNRFKQYVIKPTFIGLFVFSIFFSIILVTKITTFLLTENTIFSLNIYDVLFALIGFIIGFFIEFLLQVKRLILK